MKLSKLVVFVFLFLSLTAALVYLKVPHNWFSRAIGMQEPKICGTLNAPCCPAKDAPRCEKDLWCTRKDVDLAPEICRGEKGFKIDFPFMQIKNYKKKNGDLIPYRPIDINTFANFHMTIILKGGKEDSLYEYFSNIQKYALYPLFYRISVQNDKHPKPLVLTHSIYDVNFVRDKVTSFNFYKNDFFIEDSYSPSSLFNINSFVNNLLTGYNLIKIEIYSLNYDQWSTITSNIKKSPYTRNGSYIGETIESGIKIFLNQNPNFLNNPTRTYQLALIDNKERDNNYDRVINFLEIIPVSDAPNDSAADFFDTIPFFIYYDSFKSINIPTQPPSTPTIIPTVYVPSPLPSPTKAPSLQPLPGQLNGPCKPPPLRCDSGLVCNNISKTCVKK